MKRVKLNRRAFARGVDEVLTLRPLRRAFWGLVSEAGYHAATFGRRCFVVGRWQQRRNRR